MGPYQSPHAAAYAQTSNNNPPAAPTPLSPSRYGLYTSRQGHPQRAMQRMPSYDAGDDAGLIDPPHSQNLQSVDGDPRYALTTGVYGFGETTQRADGVDWEDQLDHRHAQQTGPGGSPQTSRSRGLSHSSSRYQYAPSLSSASSSQQRPYNPQEYVIPPTPSQQQSGLNSLAYSNSNTSYTPTTPGPQPYNPAAYQRPISPGMELRRPFSTKLESRRPRPCPTGSPPSKYLHRHRLGDRITPMEAARPYRMKPVRRRTRHMASRCNRRRPLL